MNKEFSGPSSPGALRIAVIGVGGIGSTFAFQLVRNGHEVIAIARPGSARFEQLKRDGGVIDLKNERAELLIGDRLDEEIPYDLVLVTLPAHQAAVVLPSLQRSTAKWIQFMFNTFDPELLRDAVGAHRCSFGMPFVQGSLDPNGRLTAKIGAGGQKTKMNDKRCVELFSVDPNRAPHGMRWGSDGQLYCVCENSGVVLELNAQTGVIQHVLGVDSNKAHRIEITPDGSKLYAETEEDGYLAILDLRSRTLTKKLSLPGELNGLGISPDGSVVLAVDSEEPQLYVVKTSDDALHATVQLKHHRKAAQIVRFSPDGRFVVVTSHDEALGTILTADLSDQRKIRLEKGPMDMAFHPDGKTVLIANQDAGSIAVANLDTAELITTFEAGRGVETLSFF